MAEQNNSAELTRRITHLVLVCFFLSGLTSLVYQVLWTKMIVKIIGSAPFAVSIVLTVFMSGLGLGSFLSGRIIDRVKESAKLVQIYGLLELAVGAYALAIPFLLSALRPLYAILYNQLFTHFMLYNLLTFIGCFILLCAPVVCMGATLPVLCRFYIKHLSYLGTHAGRLYGLNTIGAAFGALLCGFWLINLLGVWGSLLFAVLINTFIGLVCIWSGSQIKTLPEQSIPHSVKSSDDVSLDAEPSESSFAANAALVIFAVSGFCGMAYEVIWTKLLGLIVGPTTYSFTIVLVSFITGLALGSIIFGVLADRAKNTIWLLICTQIAAALVALFVSQLLGNSQLFFAKLIFTFRYNFFLLNLLKAVVLFAFIILPTICLGATFPLVGKICTRSVAKVGKSVGSIYAVNTIGAVTGSFCAGFLFIPLFGKEKSLSFIITAQLLTSLIVAVVLTKNSRSLWKFVTPAITLAGLVLCLYFPFWNRNLLASGKYHRFENSRTFLKARGWLELLLRSPEEVQPRTNRWKLVYYGDGIGGFTTVWEYTDPFGNAVYIMANSGKVDASSRGDMPTQTLSAHFPMLFHENPKTVMVLGLASGITAGEVLYYPIERLDVVEIGRQVVEASDFLRPWNNSVLSNPKTNLIIQDGRAHLFLTKRKYDVIISEPSNPWMAGMADLFTRDFFIQVRDRLNTDGIFTQWLHSYQMDWPTFALICRTFADVFPNSLLLLTDYSKSSGDYLLVGFKGANKLVLDNAEKKLTYIRQSKNVNLPDPKVLYPLIMSEDLHFLVDEGPLNTDNFPRLEFDAPKMMYHDDPTIDENIQSDMFLSAETKNIIRQVVSDVNAQIDIAMYSLSLYAPFSDMLDFQKATPSQKDRFLNLLWEYCANNEVDSSIFSDGELRQKCLSIQIESLGKKVSLTPDKALSYFYLATLYDEAGMDNKAIDCYRTALQFDPDFANAHSDLAVMLLRQGKIDEAIKHHCEVLRNNPYNALAYSNLAHALIRKGKYEEAVKNFNKALKVNPDFAEAHHDLGITLSRLDRHAEAASHFSEALRIKPDFAVAHYNLGIEFVHLNKLDDATECFKSALILSPDLVDAHYNLAVTLAQKGSTDEAISHFLRTVQLKPDFAGAHNELAVQLARVGKLDEAIQHLSQALQIDPNFVQARQNLNTILAAKNEPADINSK